MAFDIEDYKGKAARLVWDDLDMTVFRDVPLDPGVLRCLRYMHDVEYHTVCYLRDLLLTPAHADPAITSFLGMWVFEEYWHGEGIAAVLAAHGEPHGDTRVRAVREGLGWRDRVRPLLITLGGALGAGDFVAVHMTWGAINEWTTQAGYSLLIRQADHPTLSELLRRIMRQEGRHIDFYSTQACERLGRSQRAQRLTRTALRHLWRPVGAGVMPAQETRFIVRQLMGGEEGRDMARRIDRRVQRLPGLSGTAVVEGAVRAWAS
ncbi:MAG: ferritin-like domain-containing protein [Acidimicrobiales bacterium]